MSAIQEYIPDSAEQTNGNGKAPPSENKRVTALASEAYQAATTDLRLDHGAVRLFLLLTERSWWFNWGGDGRGGIIISIQRLYKKIGGNRNFVTKWLRELERFGYIWREKIPNERGYPVCKYFISFLVPKTAQRELPLNGSSGITCDTGAGITCDTGAGITCDTGAGITSDTGAGITSDTLKEVKGSYREGDPPDYSADLKNGPYRKGKFARLFPREIEAHLERVKSEIKSLRAEPANFKRELAPDVQATLTWLFEESAKLENSKKPADVKKLKDFRQGIRDRQNNPKNYVSGALTPSAAAALANLTRKKTELEGALSSAVMEEA